MGSGAVSVMMTGQTEMPQWFAGNWDSGKSCGTVILQIETVLRSTSGLVSGGLVLVLAHRHVLEGVGCSSHYTVCVWSDTSILLHLKCSASSGSLGSCSLQISHPLSNCSGTAKARAMAYFGEGHGPIHLGNIECSGMEHTLGQCAMPDTRIHSCWHSEDAGVICDYVEEKVQDIRRTGNIPIFSMQESGALVVGSLHAFVVFPCHSCLWLKLHLQNKHVLSCTSYICIVFSVPS